MAAPAQLALVPLCTVRSSFLEIQLPCVTGVLQSILRNVQFVPRRVKKFPRGVKEFPRGVEFFPRGVKLFPRRVEHLPGGVAGGGESLEGASLRQILLGSPSAQPQALLARLYLRNVGGNN